MDVRHARHAGTTRGRQLPGQTPDGAARGPGTPGIPDIAPVADITGHRRMRLLIRKIQQGAATMG
jgi:hypothetical protein